ncbi:hypothetical protein VB10N_43450 [Vibrio sp. 10N]|nr:hypothetical protein VB10N_43450 [Vibrio sp. 10N]
MFSVAQTLTITFFVVGIFMAFWFVVVGAILCFVTPKSIKEYAFTTDHYTEVELAVASGFHFFALIHGIALMTVIVMPKIAKRRGLTGIRSVCPPGFVRICYCYIGILWTSTITTMLCFVLVIVIDQLFLTAT